MELHAAHNKDWRGGSRHMGKWHASLFRPGVFYTWNFSVIYQEALDFQGEIPSCDFACLRTRTPRLDTSEQKTIDCTWFHLPQTFCYYYIPAEMIKIYYSIIPKADIFSYAAIQKFFVSLKYLFYINFVVICFLIQLIFF